MGGVLTGAIPDLLDRGATIQLEILSPTIPGGGAPSTYVSLNGLIDTGAGSTLIGRDVARRLGLVRPRRFTVVRSVHNHPVPLPGYDVEVRFPEHGVGFMLIAFAAPLPDPVECLVGRDILSRTTLVYLGAMQVVSLAVPEV